MQHYTVGFAASGVERSNSDSPRAKGFIAAALSPPRFLRRETSSDSGFIGVRTNPELRLNTFVAFVTLIIGVAALLISATNDQGKRNAIIAWSAIPVFVIILFVLGFFWGSF